MTVNEREVEEGKIWAILSHLSLFTGLPLFAIPLLYKHNAFALQHAKWAGAAYAGALATWILVSLISLITCGMGAVLYVLILSWWIPAVQGLLGAAQGKLEEPLFVGAIAQKLFSSILLIDQG